MIPFNRPYLVGSELENIRLAHQKGQLAGDGEFTKACHIWLEKNCNSAKALLTHSCTAALEMAALLANIKPGDEVIMPSYTFVSTANAFVLRGGIPVFVDIRPDTLNINEKLLQDALTLRTKVIVPVHYAGVACEMDEIIKFAKCNDLIVVEDAAQGILSSYKGIPLGSIGDFGALSFHETKNITSGEGGAILIKDRRHALQAEIIRDKGTNRSSFFRGEIDKYSWVGLGSSFLPGEMSAAFLYAQMYEAESITKKRMNIWNKYHESFSALEISGIVRRPKIPDECSHNAHMYYLLLPSLKMRTQFIEKLRSYGIQCPFHYVPLHRSIHGKAIGRTVGDLAVTDSVSDRLVRLPMWIGIEPSLDYVIEKVIETLKRLQ